MALSIVNKTKEAVYYTNFDDPVFGRLGTKVIVVHSTAGKTAAGALSWFTNKKRKEGSSAHYIIDTDGVIYEHIPEQNVSWHAGDSAWIIDGVKRTQINRWSIGIEVACEEFGKYTQAQLDSLHELTVDIAKRYSIPFENIIRHKDVTTAKPPKRDPYPSNLDWDSFKQKLSMELNIPTPKKLALYEEDVRDYVKSLENSQNAILHDVEGFIADMTPYKVLIAIINSNPVRQQEYAAFVAKKHHL